MRIDGNKKELQSSRDENVDTLLVMRISTALYRSNIREVYFLQNLRVDDICPLCVAFRFSWRTPEGLENSNEYVTSNIRMEFRCYNYFIVILIVHSIFQANVRCCFYRSRNRRRILLCTYPSFTENDIATDTINSRLPIAFRILIKYFLSPRFANSRPLPKYLHLCIVRSSIMFKMCTL